MGFPDQTTKLLLSDDESNVLVDSNIVDCADENSVISNVSGKIHKAFRSGVNFMCNSKLIRLNESCVTLDLQKYFRKHRFLYFEAISPATQRSYDITGLLNRNNIFIFSVDFVEYTVFVDSRGCVVIDDNFANRFVNHSIYNPIISNRKSPYYAYDIKYSLLGLDVYFVNNTLFVYNNLNSIVKLDVFEVGIAAIGSYVDLSNFSVKDPCVSVSDNLNFYIKDQKNVDSVNFLSEVFRLGQSLLNGEMLVLNKAESFALSEGDFLNNMGDLLFDTSDIYIILYLNGRIFSIYFLDANSGFKAEIDFKLLNGCVYVMNLSDKKLRVCLK